MSEIRNFEEYKASARTGNEIFIASYKGVPKLTRHSDNYMVAWFELMTPRIAILFDNYWEARRHCLKTWGKQ